jgi:hypothetical protein
VDIDDMQPRYVHPVVSALGTLDRSADNYAERRVKIINKYTHTIDPVMEVVRRKKGAGRGKEEFVGVGARETLFDLVSFFFFP